MRVLITGIRGFTGRHLLEHLKDNPDTEVFGADVSEDLEHECHACDLTDRKAVSALLDAIKPDQIYQLAGTFTNDYETDYRSNVLTTKCLLDEVLAGQYDCRVLLVGSSAEYGLVRNIDNPIKETQPLKPVSVYGLTKVCQYHLVMLYHSLYNMNVVMVRPFNLMGEGVSESLFVGRLQKLIREYLAGNATKIRLGNLSTRRDYLHIDQAVKDYALVMNAGISGEVYNVGAGKSVAIKDLLSSVLEENGLDMSVVEESSRSLVGKFDVEDIYADISKIETLRKLK